MWLFNGQGHKGPAEVRALRQICPAEFRAIQNIIITYHNKGKCSVSVMNWLTDVKFEKFESLSQPGPTCP